MPEIVLTFVKGEVKVEAFGFKGQSCAEATRYLKETLGESTDFQQKAEWFETNLELGNINTNLCG